jgi:hypothetical protein
MAETVTNTLGNQIAALKDSAQTVDLSFVARPTPHDSKIDMENGEVEGLGLSERELRSTTRNSSGSSGLLDAT